MDCAWSLSSVLASTTSVTLKHLWIGVSSNVWRTLVILFLLGNLKALPFMWHCRLFLLLINHLIVCRRQKISSAQHSGSALFEPIITTTSSPLLEIDFNLHKSNSTFFTDLDINRIHLLSLLFKTVIDPSLKPGPTKDGKLGRLVAALGGTSCSFRREIKLYEKYEIWSRVLCWDEKWLYIVSHFVRAGSVTPQGYRLPASQDAGRKARKSRGDANGDVTERQPFSSSEAVTRKVVLASAISKYVFKQGWKTIPAGTVLEELGLLPARNGVAMTDSRQSEGGNKDEVIWDWNRVQQENQRGLAFAKMFAGLDNLPEVFSGDSAAALGHFGAFL